MVTHIDEGLFEQIFRDFETRGVGDLRAGMMSLDQREGPADEMHQLKSQALQKSTQGTWFRAEMEPAVGTCLFFEFTKTKVEEQSQVNQLLYPRMESKYSITNLNERSDEDNDP